MKKHRPILVIIGMVIVFSFLIIVMIGVLNPTERTSLILEFGKKLIQLLVLGILGIVFKFAIEDIFQSFKNRDDERKFLSSLIFQLRDIHTLVKVSAFQIERQKTKSAYENAILSLLKPVHDLKFLGDNIRHSSLDALSNKELGEMISNMISYLNSVVDESLILENYQSGSEIILPRLNSLISGAVYKDKDESYENEYHQPYIGLKKALREKSGAFY